MTTAFEDITYKALQLAVFTEACNLSVLSIFEETKVFLPEKRVNVHAGIIGTSHFVQFRYEDGRVFTELFACAVGTGQPKPTYFAALENLTKPVYLQKQGISYQFKQQKKHYNAQNPERLRLDAPFIFLEFYFKTPASVVATSCTMLAVSTIEKGFKVQTLHEYPEEETVVFSESLILLD